MSTAKPRILLVEDDLSFGKILKDYLALNGLEVVLQKDGLDGWNAFRHHHFDLCILDVMMPKRDGFELAEQIRQVNRQVPLFFLTAKAQKTDVLAGYQTGADDYIAKPVDADVLLHKIRAVLKRTAVATVTVSETTRFAIGPYQFDFETRQLALGEARHTLSPKEADLLRLLAENMNGLVKREDILRQLWKEVNYFTGRSLDVYIAKLRKYLQESEQVSLNSLHKGGYILEIKD